MFGKKKKKKRVCKDCGYVGRNFMKRKVYHGAFGGSVEEKQYRCPECGSDWIVKFDNVLDDMIKDKYGKENEEEPEAYHRSVLFDEDIQKAMKESLGEETDLTEIFEGYHDQKVRLYNLLNKYNPEDLVDALEEFLEENAEDEEEKKLKSALADLGYTPGTIKRIMKGDVDG